MLGRNQRAADRVALEPAGLDQSRRVFAGRVAKHRAGIGLAQRLARDTLRKQLLDFIDRFLSAPGLQAERCRDKPLFGGMGFDVRLQAHVPISNFIVPRRAHPLLACSIHGVHARHDVPGFAAVAAGVHRQRPADGARDSRKKFRARQVMARGETRDPRTGHARLGVDLPAISTGPYLFERAVSENHRAAQTRIAHQQVAAEADEINRFGCRLPAQELAQVGKIGREICALDHTAGAPAHVTRHRFALLQFAAQSVHPGFVQLAHIHISGVKREVQSASRFTFFPSPASPARCRSIRRP